MSGSAVRYNLQSINPRQILAAIRKEKARRAEGSLPEYIKQVWPTIEPGTRYVPNWHIDCIGEYLEAVDRHEIRRLIINIPPRHMKSLEVTVCYPTWSWITNPWKRFIKVSYSDMLSRKHNILSRDIITSPWYQDNWGDRYVLKGDVNRQNQFANDHHGMMYSTSTGGALTGEGGDVIIVDDPQNPLMANSETEREASINFFKNTLQTRLNDPKTGAIIVVMQRLHEQDLTGYILAEDLGYEHLCLPAIAEKHTVVTFPISGREVVREEGDLLNPGRFDRQSLDDLKRSMGSLQFAGQFQQTPAPAGGIIFKREWLGQFYRQAPTMNMLIQSWDQPFTKSEGSAKCAGIVMGRRGADIYVFDLVNEKMEFTESVAAMRSLSGKWPKARAKVVENKANGPAIVSLLHKEIPGLVEFNPKGSKEERALSITPYLEAGNLHLPDPVQHPWVHDFIEDLLRFPKGTYKDTVDAFVQGVLYLMDKPAVSAPPVGTMQTHRSYWGAIGAETGRR